MAGPQPIPAPTAHPILIVMPLPALRRSSLITALSTIGFFAIFSTTISKNPVLPLFSSAFGADDVTIGLIAAVSPDTVLSAAAPLDHPDLAAKILAVIE